MAESMQLWSTRSIASPYLASHVTLNIRQSNMALAILAQVSL
jgi:hypothetical protein